MTTILAANLVSSPEGCEVSTDTTDVVNLVGFRYGIAVCVGGVVDIPGGGVVIGVVAVARRGVVSSCLMTALRCDAVAKVGTSRRNLVVFSRHFLGCACCFAV